jgi:hypothetical protein
MGVEVLAYNVRSPIGGTVHDIEVEVIVDDGNLRAGDGCVRRFWLDGMGRPMYLGHLPTSEKNALVTAVRDEAERLRRAGKKAPPAESRWGL